jgi:hypothetical protein
MIDKIGMEFILHECERVLKACRQIAEDTPDNRTKVALMNVFYNFTQTVERLANEVKPDGKGDA